MPSLSRDPSDIEAETRTSYELTTMTGFRTDMTVKEKLFLGLSHMFSRKFDFDAQAQQNPDHLISLSRNEIMARGGIHLTDRVLGFPYALQQEGLAREVETRNRMYGLSAMDTTLEMGDEEKDDPVKERRRLRQHFLARTPFVKGAHARLATVLRSHNKKVHTIPGLVTRRQTGQIMNVEWRQDYGGMAMNMSFSAFQSRSMEANGYRRREIRCLHFLRVNDKDRASLGPQLDTATAKDYGAEYSTEMFLQNGVDGNLSVIELDITDVTGRKRRWVCIEITKPLVQAHGPVPSELVPMPRSYLRIAAPSDKTSVMTTTEGFDAWRKPSQSPHLGNFEKLTIRGPVRTDNANKVRLRMCRDGVPIFATGSKRGISDASRIDDFLSANNVIGLPWKETDRRVSNNTKNMRKHEFWERYHSAADTDKAQWMSLQDAMAKDNCVVDMTFEGEWDE
ncbi:hypothetical protein CSHISOI_01020, partial [Colletotrichum shisoi]